MLSTFNSIGSQLNSSNKKNIPSVMKYYWTFEDGLTNTASVSPATQTTVLSLSNSAGIATTGAKEGSGYKCFSSYNQTYTADSSSLSISTSNGITICFWVKSQASPLGANKVLFSAGPSSTIYKIWILLGTTNTPTFEVMLFNSAGTQCFNRISLNTAFSADTWYHIAVTWKSNIMYTYINGQRITFTTVNIASINPTTWTTVQVNGLINSSSNFIGWFAYDCIRIYEGELSASEINTIYTDGN